MIPNYFNLDPQHLLITFVSNNGRQIPVLNIIEGGDQLIDRKSSTQHVIFLRRKEYLPV